MYLEETYLNYEQLAFAEMHQTGYLAKEQYGRLPSKHIFNQRQPMGLATKSTIALIKRNKK